MARKNPNPLTLCEIEQIKVLKASGLSYYAVAKKLGRNHKTIKRCCMEPRNAKEIKIIQQELAGYFEDLSMRFITSISDEDIEKLNGYQRIISAGICVDKLRLLRNESTENISLETIHARREDREKRMLELIKEREELTGESAETRRNKPEALLKGETPAPKQNDEKVVDI